MNIASSSKSSSKWLSSKPHSIVNELQKQKKELTTQIQKVNEGTGDSKTKAEKVKVINAQIEELNKQIHQVE